MDLFKEMAKKIFSDKIVLSKGEFRRRSAINFKFNPQMSNKLMYEMRNKNLLDMVGRRDSILQSKINPIILNKNYPKLLR